MKTETGKKSAKPLGPLDPLQRYTLAEAAAYLRTSLPTIHKHINSGVLETFNEGRRRYVPGSAIAVLSRPPAERPQAAA